MVGGVCIGDHDVGVVIAWMRQQTPTFTHANTHTQDRTQRERERETDRRMPKGRENRLEQAQAQPGKGVLWGGGPNMVKITVETTCTTMGLSLCACSCVPVDVVVFVVALRRQRWVGCCGLDRWTVRCCRLLGSRPLGTKKIYHQSLSSRIGSTDREYNRGIVLPASSG